MGRQQGADREGEAVIYTDPPVPPKPDPILERIARALERIADVLEGEK